MKHKILISFLVALLLALGGYLFFAREKPKTYHPSRGQTLIMFGDSFVRGYGASEGNRIIADRIVPVLKRMIKE